LIPDLLRGICRGYFDRRAEVRWDRLRL